MGGSLSLSLPSLTGIGWASVQVYLLWAQRATGLSCVISLTLRLESDHQTPSAHSENTLLSPAQAPSEGARRWHRCRHRSEPEESSRLRFPGGGEAGRGGGAGPPACACKNNPMLDKKGSNWKGFQDQYLRFYIKNKQNKAEEARILTA